MPTYDKAYFIAKFEAIPDADWTTGDYVDDRGRRCAYGHCGSVRLPSGEPIYSDEAEALEDIFVRVGDFASWINDGLCRRFLQATPK